MLRASPASPTCAAAGRTTTPRLLWPHASRPRAPIRSWKRASVASSDAESKTSSLSRLLGESLSTRASDATRKLIDAEVQRLEREPGPEAPIASRLLEGAWKLRYTSSPGTVGAIAGWETFAGAVTDVRQTCATREENDVVVTNVVAVAVPLVSGEVRITQTFRATAVSKRRWRVRLRTSDVDVRTTGGAFPSVPFLSFSQPGASAQPAKTQLVTHLSRKWRVVRETRGNAVSVYSRVEDDAVKRA